MGRATFFTSDVESAASDVSYEANENHSDRRAEFLRAVARELIEEAEYIETHGKGEFDD